MASHDGSIIIKAVVDKKQAQKELTALEKEIDKTEQHINDIQAERDEANQASIFKAAELDAEKAKLEQIKMTLQEIKATAKDTTLSESVRAEAAAQLPTTKTDLQEQQARVSMLQTEYNKVAGSVERYDKSLSKATKKLDRQKTRAGELVKQISSTPKYYENMAAAQERAEKSAARWSLRMKEVLRSALVFTLISQALAKFREWMGKVIKTDDEAAAAMARLQGALLTLAQPIVNVLIPALTAFLNILTAVVTAIANVVSILFGGSLSQSKKQAKALHEETKALEGVGGAAEKAAGSLASFDEINTLSSPEAAGGGGGISGEEELFPEGDQFNSQQYMEEMEKLTVYISGALLALGAILFFSGANMPLGLGLMVVGALGLAAMAKENWNDADGKVREAINRVLLILGASFLVLGAILAFSGVNPALGLGLMAVGAAALVTYAALNWDSMSEPVRKAVTAIMTILGAAMLVIGAILAFSGGGPKKVAMGIAIMVIGAASLATAAALNWDYIEQALKGPIGVVTALLSTAMLVIGAILAFSGGTPAKIGLGVALMVAGAAGLVTTVVVNWNYIEQALKGPIGAVTAIVGAAVLVLGAILTFSGVNPVLGIALMALGGVALVTPVVLNWDWILEKLKGAWNDIKTWWKNNVSKYFTLQYWKDLGADMIDGLLEGLSGIFGKISTWASDVWNSITNGISGNASATEYGVSVSSMPTSSTYSVPALATGAVIPPNREFMAILGDQTRGTNIETPESLLRKIVREESGDSDVLAVLRELLAVTRAGKNIVVDKRVLGKVASEAITERARASGKDVVTT